MSLRTSPQTGVAAQLSATKERYRCGVPLAGAIRSPFGTAPGDRNYRTTGVIANQSADWCGNPSSFWYYLR